MRMPLASARRIFSKGLEAVSPSVMISNHLIRQGNKIKIENQIYELHNNVHIVGFGKAVAGMCRAVQDVLNDHIVRGIISVPTGLVENMKRANKSWMLPVNDGKISLFEGAANNLPDDNSHETTLKIIELVKLAKEDDLVIVLISGGGSALLCAPVPPVSLQDKIEVTRMLSRCGASIEELNTIRRRLSLVKGGGLARMAYPAKVITLILSDIVGDPLDLIASGPTINERSSVQDCASILEKFNLVDKIPVSTKQFLLESGNQDGTIDKMFEKGFHHVKNVLVGTNTIAINAACVEANDSRFLTIILSNKIQGEAKTVGIMMIELGFALERILSDLLQVGQGKIELMTEKDFSTLYFGAILQNPLLKLPFMDDFQNFIKKILEFVSTGKDFRKICVISAGETTVTVTGDGVGGRNQEMALAAAIHYYKHCLDNDTENVNFNPDNFDLSFLSAGTDGQDGPTDATGAVFDSCNCKLITTEDDLILAEKALANNDSYNFLKQYSSNLITTGLTGTNVMDIQVLTVEMK